MFIFGLTFLPYFLKLSGGIGLFFLAYNIGGSKFKLRFDWKLAFIKDPITKSTQFQCNVTLSSVADYLSTRHDTRLRKIIFFALAEGRSNLVTI